MAKKLKHIPENSIVIIIKFNTNTKKAKLMKDPEFQQVQGNLMNIATEKGATWECFTHP